MTEVDEIHIKILWFLLAVCGVALCVCFFLVGTAFAEENGSYVIVEMLNVTPTATPLPTNIQYIQQGQVVAVGDTIDISGVVPPYPFLAYWDGYDMYDKTPSYNMSLPERKKGYYQFYLDPEIFGSRLGRWYKYDGRYENQGNNRAFTVVPKTMVNSTMTFPNGTVVNLTEVIPMIYPEIQIKPDPPLPERHITDYVVARGDSLELPNNSYQVWIFGRVNGVYASKIHTLTGADTQGMEPGNYRVVFHYPGRNTIYEATCLDSCKQLSPGLYGKEPIDIYGLAPSVVYDRLRMMLADTDDTLEEYNLLLEEPYITINEVNEIYRNKTDALNVRGYSNVRGGTAINVSLDYLTMQFRHVPQWYSEGTAIQNSRGNLSMYSINVPFNYDDLAADARNHTLVAQTALGGRVEKDFKISVMPADSFKPNATLKYIEDRNPFVATPTPEVITKIQTQVVVQTITVPVTPSEEVVYEQQRKAQEDVAVGWFTTIVIVSAILALVIGLILYGLVVWRRL